jgi:two-component system heavy metal sensor histidine kinase CusS
MLLKNVKTFFSQTRSITTRLTFFYALATFILLIVIALFLYFAMIGILYQNNSQFLSDEIDVIKYLLASNDHDQSALNHEVRDVPFVLAGSIHHYSIRVIDNANHVVMQTPGMRERMRDAGFFNKISKEIGKRSEWWYSANGDKYLLMESAVRLGKDPKDVWLIQASLDVSDQHAAIDLYRKRAITVLVGGELFAIFIGYLIARRGLRRLYELTDTTKKITATSLNQRIATKSWPKELRKLGLAFNQMLDRIEVAFSHLTQFSDDLAHELRTPVNNLMGQTEIALTSQSLPEEYAQVLESNLEELQRISQIIENILFLARAENPQLDLKKVQLNVEDEISMVCEFYQAMADDKNIKVSMVGKAAIFANQVMFRRMISNILSNALKYTPANGTVDFSIRETDQQVEIKLHDTGIGIPAEHLPKILNRFYRVDPARSQHTGSVGLGLAIVKSIVYLHEGTMLVNSEPGDGTTILLEFPKMIDPK